VFIRLVSSSFSRRNPQYIGGYFAYGLRVNEIHFSSGFLALALTKLFALSLLVSPDSRDLRSLVPGFCCLKGIPCHCLCVLSMRLNVDRELFFSLSQWKNRILQTEKSMVLYRPVLLMSPCYSTTVSDLHEISKALKLIYNIYILFKNLFLCSLRGCVTRLLHAICTEHFSL
jgi:hypothetical protein